MNGIGLAVCVLIALGNCQDLHWDMNSRGLAVCVLIALGNCQDLHWDMTSRGLTLTGSVFITLGNRSTSGSEMLVAGKEMRPRAALTRPLSLSVNPRPLFPLSLSHSVYL